MHNMLIITFETENTAYNGARMLWRLHENSGLTVYATTILARAADGSIDTLQQVDRGPLGTVIGTVAGSIIGSIGGPLGTATGAVIGAARGTMLDYWDSGIRRDVLNQVSTELKPGTFLVLADVTESENQLVDEQIAEFGGTILRRSKIHAVADYVEHELAERKTKLQQLQLKAEKVAAELRESVMNELKSARADFNVARKTAYKNLKAEAAARRDVIEKQIKNAPDEMKKMLEAANAIAQAEADRRIAELEKQSE